MKAVIIAHGSLQNSDILKRECENSDIVICADGGAEFAKENGVIPDYLIGDFDSIDKEVFDFYKVAASSNTKIIEYPCDKDFTDTELCVDKAIELGSTEICIAAGIGSRLDHSLGNILLLHKILEKGIKGYIAAQDCYIYLCNSNHELYLQGDLGQTISILPFMGNVGGVNLEGLKFPLKNATIRVGQSIGLSNVFVKKLCKIEIEKGELLIIKNNHNDF